MAENSTPPSGQALPVRARLEEFEVEGVLGSGGFGITYLAHDTSLNRRVVIKENLPGQFAARDPASGIVSSRTGEKDVAENFAWSLQNFLREANTLALLDHAGIVKVLRKFEANGTAYFVMPYEEGEVLDVMLKSRNEQGKSFSEYKVMGLLEHLLDALDYMHEREIYHRDIKPGNILIKKEGVPVLIDFGSARQRLSERSMTVVESAGYTPFEQLQSQGKVGPWSDLYSLGATLVKMLTGERPPKAADRALDDPWQPLAERSELTGRYSKKLLKSIDRSLATRISDRIQNVKEWLEALKGEEPVPEDKVGPAKWHRKASEQGDVVEQFNLGVMHATGKGVEQDYVEAVKWYRKAAEQDYAKAQFNLGVAYEYGRGVPKDNVEAVNWYRKASKQGDVASQFNLGNMYANGKGVTKDDVEAVKWYRKAAQQDLASAQNALGDMYAKGEGVAKDGVEAVKWYRKAAAQGYAAAESALRRLGVQ